MNKTTSAKHWFIQTALSYLGKPYIWGGDDPSGFDCSGLVVECLKTAGLMTQKEDLSADLLLKRWHKVRVESPKEGCLLFWVNQNGTAYHVAICLDESFHISAGGGDSTTKNEDEAWKQNAFVRIRPIRFTRTRQVIVDPFSQPQTTPE